MPKMPAFGIKTLSKQHISAIIKEINKINYVDIYVYKFIQRTIIKRYMKTRKTTKEKNIRKLTKIAGGSSYAITLPIDVVRRWGWRNKQKLQLEIDDKKQTIKVKDWE